MESKPRKPIYLPPGEGRRYSLGRGSAIFKADGDETAGTFSVSEWWLEAKTKGPTPHSHENDHVYYVLDGTVACQVDGRWYDAPKRAFLLIPGGSVHTFENRTEHRAGFLSFDNDAGFEERMPGISEWFRNTPRELS